MKVVTGLFGPNDLIIAVSGLTEERFDYEDLSVLSSASEMPSYLEGDPEDTAVSGAAVGAATGGVLGALGAWVSPSVPGFESMFATGLLTTTAGSVIGGYLGSLYSVRAESQTKLDVHKELEAGNMLLVVRTDEEGASTAASLMEEANGRDVEVHEIEE